MNPLLSRDRRRWKAGQWDCPEVLLNQSTTRTDGGIMTYLAGCITPCHMSLFSIRPQGRACLTEFVPGNPAQTPWRHELLSPSPTNTHGRSVFRSNYSRWSSPAFICHSGSNLLPIYSPHIREDFCFLSDCTSAETIRWRIRKSIKRKVINN